MKKSSRAKDMELSIDNISKLLDSKLQLLPSKDDFKQLERKIDQLTLENNALQQEIVKMKARENKLNDTVEYLINRGKIKNLVFRGLGKDKSKNVAETVTEFCREVLEVQNPQLNRVFEIKNSNNALVAEFTQESTTYDVLTKSRKLKGTGIIIHRDVSSRTRRKKRCLLQVRKRIMEVDKQNKIKMRDSFFIYKERRFDWNLEEGLQCEGREGISYLKQLLGSKFDNEMECGINAILEADKQFGLGRDKGTRRPST